MMMVFFALESAAVGEIATPLAVVGDGASPLTTVSAALYFYWN